MLSQLRKGVSSWIAKIFIGILILSFAVWGVSGIALTSTSNTLAEVGDIEISRQDFEKTLPLLVNEWGQRLKQRLTRQQVKALQIPHQAKARLIDQAVLENHARDLSLGVSDEQIGRSIANDPELRDGTGQFNKELLKQILRSERISEAEYFNEKRKAAVRQQLTSMFYQTAGLPDVLIESMYHYREDRLKIAYFTIPEKSIKQPKAPTEAELRAYYEETKTAYIAPEYRRAALFVISMAELMKSFTPSDDDIKAMYEARKKGYVTPESRTYKQIVFEDKAKADEAHAALKKGETFDKVAKQFGKDGKATSVGPIRKTAMADKVLAEAVFTLKKDEFTAPVEGTFATMIAQVTTINPRVEKTLEDVRNDIIAELQKRDAAKKLKSLYDQVEDLRASGTTVEEVAREMQGKAIILEAIDSKSAGPDGKPVADLPPTQKLTSEIFEAAIGDDTVPVRHQDGGYVWFDVQKITPQRTKGFDEVKQEVKDAFLNKQTQQAAADFAGTLEKRIKDGETFEKVAASLKAKIVKPESFARGGSANDIPVVLGNRLFTTKTGEVATGLGDDNKKWLVVKVLGHEKAKTEGKAYDAYRKKLVDELGAEIREDLFSQYMSRAKSIYKVEENQQMFQQLVDGL